MIRIDPNTRIVDLTVGELMDYLQTNMEMATTKTPSQQELPNRRFVYGIAGIAQLFNCSMTTANRIKSKGYIDKAITQYGRKIVVDADLALELYNNK